MSTIYTCTLHVFKFDIMILLFHTVNQMLFHTLLACKYIVNGKLKGVYIPLVFTGKFLDPCVLVFQKSMQGFT